MFQKSSIVGSCKRQAGRAIGIVAQVLGVLFDSGLGSWNRSSIIMSKSVLMKIYNKYFGASAVTSEENTALRFAAARELLEDRVDVCV